MKILSVTPVGKKKVYDISVDEAEHYVLKNNVVTHNTGMYLSADNILIMGRQQEKDGKDIIGYNFIINVEKSRHVKEKTKIPLSITYEDGISKWSGLLDMALEANLVVKPKNGRYARVDLETGEVLPENLKVEQTNNKEFWNPILESKAFNEWVENRYSVSKGKVLQEEDDESSLSSIYADVEEEYNTSEEE